MKAGKNISLETIRNHKWLNTGKIILTSEI